MSDWVASSKAGAPDSRVPRGILPFLRAGYGHAYPSYLVRGEGAYVWDSAGRIYLDWVLGKGAVTLGHARTEVDASAADRARQGFLFAGCPIEYEQLAEQLAKLLPLAEKTIFAKNGSDAVQIAIRLARAFTGRVRIASAGYHGWDHGAGVDDFGYDLAELEALAAERDRPLAAVLVTPEPGFFDASWLERCAEIARGAGAIFISDEVRAGMRLSHGGASEFFGVRPDLFCLSKGLANGYPLAAVTGRAEVLDASAKTFVFGTYYAEAVALAAGLACLRIYERESIVERVWDAGRSLMSGLDQIFIDEGIAARSIGPAPMPQILFENERAEELFYDRSVAGGILFFQNDGQCPSAQHGQQEIETTVTTCREVARSIRREVQGEQKHELREFSPATIARYAERRMIRPSALALDSFSARLERSR